MAGGEKAKSSGEYGEKIVANILELIGWKSIHSGVTVPCIFSEKHTKEGNKSSEKHGIDYIFQYKCPLKDQSQQDVLISVKCIDEYPVGEQGASNKFKEFLVDLTNAAECYPGSEVHRRKINNTTKRDISGVIFWINRNQGDGREYETVIGKIKNIRVDDNLHRINISLVDNRRAQFIYEVIKFASDIYGKDNIEFFYISTGLNNTSIERTYTGKIMPIEYLCADVIPLVIRNGKETTLFIASNDEFCESYLRRMIGVAQEISNSLTGRVVIAFKDFNEFDHKAIVTQAKYGFEDTDFLDKIEIVTFHPDFRDGVM